jgi:ABC-type bacteriocin/lantibiotic exporter with double-glycine peptidase domain
MNAELATRKLELLFGVAHRLLFGLERVAVVWLGALLVLDRFSRGHAVRVHRLQGAVRGPRQRPDRQAGG